MKKNKKKNKPVEKKLINNILNHYGNMNSSLVIVLFLLSLGIGLYLLSYSLDGPRQNKIFKPKDNGSKDLQYDFSTQLAKFQSADEFKDYLSQGQLLASSDYYGNMGVISREVMVSAPAMADMDFGAGSLDAVKSESSSVNRYSETNVQVAGIDEPDIIKTDGQNIFYAKQPVYDYGYERMMAPDNFSGTMPMIDVITKPYYPQPQNAETTLVKAWPFADMKFLSKIDKSGELLVKDNMLVVFSGREINGYDITDKEKPNKKWTINLDDDSQTVFDQARLYGDSIYLLTHTYANYNEPCPIRPLTYNNEKLTIACSDIYHPILPTSANATYTAMKVDVKSGNVSQTTSFLASYGQSVTYMSKDNLYITYPQAIDMFTFYSDFLTKDASDLLSTYVQEKITKLKSYDISNSTKMAELSVIIDTWKKSLGKDQNLKVETELQNRFQNYYQNNKRNLTNTGIVKIAIKDLGVKASGAIAGSPLNQFSLDEYNGNLRIATTLGGGWDAIFSGNSDSTNDLYVLGPDLKMIGKLLDMGLTERIYSARFIEDKAYIVTFRQVDPFYVIDLKDPKNPLKKGELKIPGYSSYLHPINQNRIIGVGEENGRVKISLFDVSDASQPQEIAKYSLDEYYTEVNNNHKAFTIDEKYKVFFLPGSKGAYIISYDDDQLSLVHAAQINQVKRAIFINDYFYIIGEKQIKVYDEKTWTEQKAFDLSLAK